jgi:hypothetical protein
VLQNAPARLRADGSTVIDEVAHCYHRDRGRGLPAGVVILQEGPAGTPSNVAPLGRAAS